MTTPLTLDDKTAAIVSRSLYDHVVSLYKKCGELEGEVNGLRLYRMDRSGLMGYTGGQRPFYAPKDSHLEVYIAQENQHTRMQLSLVLNARWSSDEVHRAGLQGTLTNQVAFMGAWLELADSLDDTENVAWSHFRGLPEFCIAQKIAKASTLPISVAVEAEDAIHLFTADPETLALTKGSVVPKPLVMLPRYIPDYDEYEDLPPIDAVKEWTKLIDLLNERISILEAKIKELSVSDNFSERTLFDAPYIGPADEYGLPAPRLEVYSELENDYALLSDLNVVFPEGDYHQYTAIMAGRLHGGKQYLPVFPESGELGQKERNHLPSTVGELAYYQGLTGLPVFYRDEAGNIGQVIPDHDKRSYTVVAWKRPEVAG